jgi:hypothetical protein
MKAENTGVVLEKTRQIANLAQEGLFNLAVAGLVDVARADESMYNEIVQKLPSYLLQGDIDDILATVEMVK